MCIKEPVLDDNQETEAERKISSLPNNKDAFNFYEASDIDNYVINNVNNIKNSLYIKCLADSGMISYIFKDVNMFTDYHPIDNIIMEEVKGTKIHTIGRGIVILLAKTSIGTCKIKLNDALHIPDVNTI